MGIEPTRDDTRLSRGFEDRGAHQLPFRPQKLENFYIIYSPSTEINIKARLLDGICSTAIM